MVNYCIKQRFKQGNKTFEPENFQTGGKNFKSFKDAQEIKKKLSRMSSSIIYKVAKCK